MLINGLSVYVDTPFIHEAALTTLRSTAVNEEEEEEVVVVAVAEEVAAVAEACPLS